MHHRKSSWVKGHYRNGIWIAPHHRKDSWVTDGIRKLFNRKVHYNPPPRRSMPNNQSNREYDRYGFDTFCYYKYTHSMYDLHGFNVYGIHRDTGTCFDIDGCNRLNEHMDDIVQVEGYDKCGYDIDGYDMFSFDKRGYHNDTKTRMNKERLSKQYFQNKLYDEKNYKWKKVQNENIRRYKSLKKKQTHSSSLAIDYVDPVYINSKINSTEEYFSICSLSKNIADKIKESLNHYKDEKNMYIQINTIDFNEHIIEILNILITKIVDMDIGTFDKKTLTIPLSNIENIDSECKCIFGFLPNEDNCQEFTLLPKHEAIIEAKEKFLIAKIDDKKITSNDDTKRIREKCYREYIKIGGRLSDLTSRKYLVYDNRDYKLKKKQDEDIGRYMSLKKIFRLFQNYIK